MASCTKCGATLVAQARFCATCGSPVTYASVAPPAPPRQSLPTPAPDPFAQTIMGGDSGPAPAAPTPIAVSPMAASFMSQNSARPSAMPRPVVSSPSPFVDAPPSGQERSMSRAGSVPPPAQPPQSQFPQQPQAPPLPPQPAAGHPFSPGMMVLVYWADGNRYPGTVLQVAQQHVFVAFPNGMQHWIDVRYVTTGS